MRIPITIVFLTLFLFGCSHRTEIREVQPEKPNVYLVPRQPIYVVPREPIYIAPPPRYVIPPREGVHIRVPGARIDVNR